jgi:ligand-binding sensor domain-containing protein
MRKLVLFLLLIMIMTEIKSQDEIWRYYASAERVNCIAFDDSDAWIGTNAGVLRINRISHNKINYNRYNCDLKSYKIYSIAIDSKGNKWFGGSDGISIFDGTNWLNFPETEIGAYLPANKILIDKDSVKWFACNNNLISFDDKNWKVHLDNSDLIMVNDLACDQYNTIWLATDKGLMKYSNDTFELIENSDLIGSKIFLYQLKFDKNGLLWIASDNGLLYFDGTTVKPTAIYEKYHRIFDLEIDKLGNIWYNQWYIDGLTKYINDTLQVNYNIFNSNISSDLITSLAFDDIGNLWIGDQDSVTIFDGNSWDSYNISETKIPINCVNDVTVDKYNNIWFGTGDLGHRGGLARYDNSSWSLYTFTSGFTPDYIECVSIDKNNVAWVGTHGDGLYQLTDTSVVNFLSYMYILSINVDNDNKIWVTTLWDGLFVYNGHSWVNYNINNSQIPSDRIYDIEFEDNKVWMASDSGLIKYENKNWELYNQVDNVIPINDVRAIAIDKDGVKWLGVDGIGLVGFNDKSWEFYSVCNPKIQYITDLVIDSCNNIWVGSWNGLAKFDRNNWKIYETLDASVSSLKIDFDGNLIIGSFFRGAFKLSFDCKKSGDTSFNLIPIKNSTTKAFPNPTFNNAFIEYEINKSSNTTLNIYTINGEKIKCINLGYKMVGNFEQAISISDFENGVYLIEILTDFERSSVRILKR